MPNPGGINQYTKGQAGRTVGRSRGTASSRLALAKVKMARRAANSSGNQPKAKLHAATEKAAMMKMAGGGREIGSVRSAQNQRQREKKMGINRSAYTVVSKSKGSGAQGGSLVAKSTPKAIRAPTPTAAPVKAKGTKRATSPYPDAAWKAANPHASSHSGVAPRVTRTKKSKYADRSIDVSGPATTIGKSDKRVQHGRSVLASTKLARRKAEGGDLKAVNKARAAEHRQTQQMGGARKLPSRTGNVRTSAQRGVGKTGTSKTSAASAFRSPTKTIGTAGTKVQRKELAGLKMKARSAKQQFVKEGGRKGASDATYDKHIRAGRTANEYHASLVRSSAATKSRTPGSRSGANAAQRKVGAGTATQLNSVKATGNRMSSVDRGAVRQSYASLGLSGRSTTVGKQGTRGGRAALAGAKKERRRAEHGSEPGVLHMARSREATMTKISGGARPLKPSRGDGTTMTTRASKQNLANVMRKQTGLSSPMVAGSYSSKSRPGMGAGGRQKAAAAAPKPKPPASSVAKAVAAPERRTARSMGRATTVGRKGTTGQRKELARTKLERRTAERAVFKNPVTHIGRKKTTQSARDALTTFRPSDQYQRFNSAATREGAQTRHMGGATGLKRGIPATSGRKKAGTTSVVKRAPKPTHAESVAQHRVVSGTGRKAAAPKPRKPTNTVGRKGPQRQRMQLASSKLVRRSMERSTDSTLGAQGSTKRAKLVASARKREHTQASDIMKGRPMREVSTHTKRQVGTKNFTTSVKAKKKK